MKSRSSLNHAGRKSYGPTRRNQRLGVGLAAISAVLALIGLLVDSRQNDPVGAMHDSDPALQGDGSDLLRLDGTRPPGSPASRMGLGPLVYGRPLLSAEAVLGSYDDLGDDPLYGDGVSAVAWAPAPGANISASVLDAGDTNEVLAVTVDLGTSDVRVAMDDGLTLGESSFGDIAVAWGTAPIRTEDLAIYQFCDGPLVANLRLEQAVPGPGIPTRALLFPPELRREDFFSPCARDIFGEPPGSSRASFPKELTPAEPE